MKKILFLLAMVFGVNVLSSQNICNPSGNLMMYTCYDGGHLNINVDANIPNLKIGIVSYEAMTITLSGAYVNNVTAITYAGFNSANSSNCGTVIPTTTITGAPSGVIPSIVNMPTSPVSNANGYPMIICGYSCDTHTSQGGCNTIDQIEGYFTNLFPGSILYAHNVQYACWTGTQNISAGGTCCTSTSVGISESAATGEFSVYPNPASEYINVKTNKTFIGSVYSVVDVNGRTVLSGKLSNENTTIKTSELSAGIYSIRIGEKSKQNFSVIKK